MSSPLSVPGSEPFVFRKVDGIELRLHVVKPEGWQALDPRVCLVAFFGGGWSSVTPERSMQWAQWAAEQGFVGMAPDYRTRKRFGGGSGRLRGIETGGRFATNRLRTWKGVL